MQDCADDASFHPQPQGDGSIPESLPATLATDSQVSVASVVQSSVPVVSSNLNAGSEPASACKESKPRIKWPKDERRVQELMLLVARCFLDMPEKILDREIEKQWLRLIQVVSKEDSFFEGTYWKSIRAKFEHYLHLFRAEQRPSSNGVGNASGNGSEVYTERDRIWQLVVNRFDDFNIRQAQQAATARVPAEILDCAMTTVVPRPTADQDAKHRETESSSSGSSNKKQKTSLQSLLSLAQDDKDSGDFRWIVEQIIDLQRAEKENNNKIQEWQRQVQQEEMSFRREREIWEREYRMKVLELRCREADLKERKLRLCESEENRK